MGPPRTRAGKDEGKDRLAMLSLQENSFIPTKFHPLDTPMDCSRHVL